MVDISYPISMKYLLHPKEMDKIDIIFKALIKYLSSFKSVDKVYIIFCRQG